MPKKKLPQGIRKFIRKEKARIRKKALSSEEKKKLVEGLYKRFDALYNK